MRGASWHKAIHTLSPPWSLHTPRKLQHKKSLCRCCACSQSSCGGPKTCGLVLTTPSTRCCSSPSGTGRRGRIIANTHVWSSRSDGCHSWGWGRPWPFPLLPCTKRPSTGKAGHTDQDIWQGAWPHGLPTQRTWEDCKQGDEPVGARGQSLVSICVRWSPRDLPQLWSQGAERLCEWYHAVLELERGWCCQPGWRDITLWVQDFKISSENCVKLWLIMCKCHGISSSVRRNVESLS